jgi:hypothetical protein
MRHDARRGRIPPPDLDDRTWQDLVTQMRSLIPKYAPQWTDQSPSDLGITLVELFAWLGEQIIYRLNQTPEKSYIAFLNLLRITRNPPSPARTHLTFRAGGVPVLVAAGAQAQTTSREGRPIVFETDEDVLVLPTALTECLSVGPLPPGAATAAYDRVSGSLVGPPATNLLLEVPAGQSRLLCLGFDRATPDELALTLRLYRPAPDAQPPTLTVTYSRSAREPLAWPPVPDVSDGTESMRHDGQIRLRVPGDWAAQRATAEPPEPGWTSVTPATAGDAVTDPLFWLGLGIRNNAATALALGLDRLLFNAAPARTALTIRAPEDLGTSTGEAFQVFELRHYPLYRGPAREAPFSHLRVQVGSGTTTVWQDWILVEDLPAGPGAVFTADPVSGEIRFGNHDPATGRGHGSVPAAGARIRALSYRHVDAGASGNVDAGQVTAPGTTISGTQISGISVSNLGRARDGVDEEAIEDTLRRAPDQLKIRDRAVTVDDYEFLAEESGEDIRIRRCLPPRLQSADAPGAPPLPWRKGDPWTYAGIVRAPGNVSVIVVPDHGPSVARPEPTPEQLRRMAGFLDRRRDLTAHLEVTGPRYLPVVVRVDVVVWQHAIDAGATLEQVRADTRAAIGRFLHPTRGGSRQEGWQVGESVLSSDLFRAIQPPPDLGYISSLLVRPDIPAYHFPPLNPGGTPGNYDHARERPFPLSPFGASVRVADYELVCAVAPASVHEVNATAVQQ